MASEATYVTMARRSILNLLEKEHALVSLEIEAKLTIPQRGLPTGLNPHILTAAKRELLDEGAIEIVTSPTRGGRTISVTALADRKGRETAFQQAAQRKRILLARYYGWTQDQPKRRSPVGHAGEIVEHKSLLAAAPTGFKLLKPEGPGIESVFGNPVPGGSLDDAAFLQTEDKDGLPTGSVFLPIEVKNVREWIYPDAAELYQLLDKAVRIKAEHPDLPMAPVLVCRRASYFATAMAKELGFFIAQTGNQFIRPLEEVMAADGRLLREIQSELGFQDLIATENEHLSLTRLFTKSLPPIAARTAERFAQAAPVLASYTGALRGVNLSFAERREIMSHLREDTKALEAFEGKW